LLWRRPAPRPPLFPYTTLFRSPGARSRLAGGGQRGGCPCRGGGGGGRSGLQDGIMAWVGPVPAAWRGRVAGLRRRRFRMVGGGHRHGRIACSRWRQRRGDPRGRDRGDQAVTALADGLDVARGLRVVVEDAAQLGDGPVE